MASRRPCGRRAVVSSPGEKAYRSEERRGPPIRWKGGFPRPRLGVVAAGLTVALVDPAIKQRAVLGVVFRQTHSSQTGGTGVEKGSSAVAKLRGVPARAQKAR
jgi:hypothetical protein